MQENSPFDGVRRWLQPDAGRGRGSDQEFFAARPDLVLAAQRAARGLRGEFVRYLDVTGNRVRRVTIDVPDADHGVARLDITDTEAPFGLTVRELQVATCVAGGLGNQEIADALGCTRRTVATHLEHVFAKTGAASRALVATLIATHDAYVAPLPSPGLVLPGPLLTVLREQPPAPSVSRAPKRQPAVLGTVYPAGGADVVAMRRGTKLAVQELNARGGIGGRRVEHVTVAATPETLLEKVNGLTERGVDAVLLGNFPLPYARPAIASVAAAGIPVLHSMTGQALSEDVHADPGGLGSVFQVCSTESAYVPGLLRTVRFLAGTGAFRPGRKRLAVLQRESTFDDGLFERVQRHADEAGWNLVFLEPVPDHTANFGEMVRRLERAEPDAVSLSIFPEPTLRSFLTAAAPLREHALMHAAWSPVAPGFTERLGGLSEGLLWSTVIGNVESPVCTGFEQRFRSTFGAEPGLAAAAVHYDIVNVLAQAWSRVSRPWDFAAVREQLRSAVSFGVTGAHQFVGLGQRGLSYPDDTVDPTRGHPHLVYRISGGTNRRLAPPVFS
ncbi:ABC transporter substrate-binding protein [Amycolatopsis acidicola]|uniref:ABC transporter substrate-binding protein n=1 Tax=Amycolatopsis acidicola TaxID=2596893 RepID=UPI001408A3F4|nr:ABC transporter substrate-binding protein [Amycolatopsis acidicola]